MSALSRLRWRCRRGMRELDLLFERFLESGYNQLTEEQKENFDRLLDCQDDRLYDWFYQGEVPGDEGLATLVARIRSDFIR